MSACAVLFVGLAAVAVEPDASAELPAGAAVRLHPGAASRAPDVDPPPGPLRNLALSADGTRIFIGGDAGAGVWDAETGRLVRQLRLADDAADPQRDWHGTAAIGIGPGVDRRGRIQKQPHVSVMALVGEQLVRWNADGSRRVVALAGLGTGTVHDGHATPPRLAAFSPDARLLVEFGEQPPIGIWDTADGRQKHQLDRSVWADLFAFSPDGRRLVVARMVRLHLFDLETGEQLWKKRLEGTVRHVQFNAGGSRLTALVDYEGLLEIDAATGDLPAATRPPLRRSRGGGPDRKIVAVSPDGTLVAESEGAAVLRVWELATGRDVLVLNGHSQPVTAVLFLPDSRRLVSATAGGSGFVWDLASPDFAAAPPRAEPLSSDEAAALWRQLGDESGEAAWQALVALVHRPDEALQVVQSPPGLEGLARRLVAQLDDADSSLRALATRRLASMSVAVEALLHEALEANPSVETAARLRRLLRRLAGPDKQDEIEKLARARRHRNLRTIRLLEWVGTSEARELLESRLLEWHDPQLTTEATRALERWPGPGGE